MTDKAQDKYLYKHYGVSLAWYNETLQKQNGGCKICGSRPITRSLPVDHDHKARYIKVAARKMFGTWVVEAEYRGQGFCFHGFKKRNEAVRYMRDSLKRASVRGIICVGCNTGIRKFRDTPQFLESAAKYLREHYFRFN